MRKEIILLTANIILIAALSALSSCGGKNGKGVPAYLDEGKPIEVRIDDALERMTLDEKIDMLHAQSKFSSPGVPRLGIPEVWTADGPHGIREEVEWDEWWGAGWTNDSCTAFPALTALAATWDREMSALYGTSVGEEARYRGKNVLLGPGVNIYRTPLNGRNFEYMGEDPFLASQMVVPYVKGVQAQGVAACVKHFALNNQEVDRNSVDVSVSDRALYEIYLPAFRAAVEQGGAWAIMGSYNKYRDVWCCENEFLLNDILKEEWNFDGVVISDWGGVHTTALAATGGLDMEFGTMPVLPDSVAMADMAAAGANGREVRKPDYDDYFMGRPLKALVESGEVSEKVIDDKVRRILRLIMRTTMDRSRPFGSFATPEHFAAARKIAEEGIVLLKNDPAGVAAVRTTDTTAREERRERTRGDKKVLPLDPEGTGKILVVGENATRWMTIGGGSSSLKAKYEITPLEGLRARFGDRVEYMQGYRSGEIVWTENGAVQIGGGVEQLEEVVVAAARAEAVVFVGGLNKDPGQDCEGDDRASMALPYGQDALIEALVAANPRTAVVIVSGNAVEMPWLDRVPAVVQGWFLGSEAGNALAAVLSGDVNPSGKLPFTYYSSLADCGAHTLGDYPGTDNRENYMDDIWVGYRYTDMKGEGASPNFPFGHGLSYTEFEYSDVEADRDVISPDGTVRVSVRVRNVGSMAGAEIVQLYIGDEHASVARPIKELKGFEKVRLRPGQSTRVTFTVEADALSFFDADNHRWTLEKGNFTAYVAASAGDVRGLVEFSVL
ncbi:MAG: glycoside hydrolase family 3 C-terminal domain-containing protein [Alistipes sp.]|jgi:beta-glucosidase|nr:glycoside hydrolase family 3 C-terminal domain-containing protein [Alistipes sp.]